MSVLYEKRDVNYEAFFVDRMNFYPHIHEKIELLYVCEGSLNVNIGNIQKTLNPGELSIVFPNQIHSYHTTQYNYVLTLIFSPKLVENYYQLLFLKQPEFPFLDASQVHPDIVHAFNTVVLDRYWDGDQSLLQGYLTIILGQVLGRLSLVTCPKTDDFLPNLLTYLSNHFTENISLNDLSHQMGISKFQISRCFSQRIGCNFNTYLNTLRIQHADKMLTTTDLPVTEISYLSGFESISTFYRVFQQIHGMAPVPFKNDSKRKAK